MENDPMRQTRVDPDGTVWKVRQLPGPRRNHSRIGIHNLSRIDRHAGTNTKRTSEQPEAFPQRQSDIEIMGFRMEDITTPDIAAPAVASSAPKFEEIRKPHQNEKG